MENKGNVEVKAFVEGRDVVGAIKAQRVRWLRHVRRMDAFMIPKTLLKEELPNKMWEDRPRIKWPDDVIQDLKIMCLRNGHCRWKIERRLTDCQGGQIPSGIVVEPGKERNVTAR